MAYTAIEAMRKKNEERFHADLGPFQPPFYQNENKPNDLKSAALRFIRCRCEGLLFDPQREEQEKQSGEYLGRGLRPGELPYNMEMDISRLSMEKAIEMFIGSGTAEDAYTVYYCYLEMFIGRYGNSKKMVELLSEYESNGSSLLMKHRDHYSHSVYVFTLGLAVYETNKAFRDCFNEFYHLTGEPENKAANLFFEYWGLTALFHDIGYPFELPFEQVLSYFEVEHKARGKDTPYLAYRAIETLTGLEEAEKARFEELYGRCFHTLSDVLAHDIYEKLGAEYGFTEEYLADVLERKPTEPQQFGYFMDHAFFSAARLYRELSEELRPENLNRIHIDALSAILLHNSLYKFSISFYKNPGKCKAPLKACLHPLAWLLMLCDELQCWDRTAYGRNSRTELHPMAADFDFSDSAICAVYYYDSAEQDKINAFKKEYKAWEEGGEQGRPPRLKAYSDMAEKEQRFTADIEKIVDTTDIPLCIRPGVKPANRRVKHIYLSGSNFLHLYDFAVALHGRYMSADMTAEEAEEAFQTMSLEYQISNIHQAKSFARYLNAIDCFYTDRPVDYEMITEFTAGQAMSFAPMEHERWVKEHRAMGWRFGREYETLPLEDDTPKARKTLREQLRRHKLMMDGELTSERIIEHYESLPEEDQDKDWKPFNIMLKLLKKFDGLRIYRL